MSVGTEIGSGAGQGGLPTSPAAIIAGLSPHDWWDFTDSASVTLSGSNITSVANKGADSDAFAHAGGVYMTHDGSKAVCNGFQNNYAAGAAGDRDFLHNGDGGEVFVIHQQSSASNEQFLIVTNDIAGSSIAAGVRFSSYQIGGVQQYISRVGYGSNHLFNQSDDGVLTLGLPLISSFKCEEGAGSTNDIVVCEDGIPLIQQTDAGVLSATNHNGPLKALVSYLGDAYGILVFDRVLSASDRAKLYTALRAHYGLERKANVTCLIGASNADGLGSGGAISATYQGVQNKAAIYAYKDGNAAAELNWWPYEQANSHVETATSSGGLDLALMYHLVDGSGVREFLVKAATSGSDLYAAWNPDDWPEYATSWYKFRDRITAAANALRAIGFTPYYRGCVVGLGENDASASFRSTTYQANQVKLNALVRGLTRADLPIVLVKCSTQEPADTSGRSDGNMSLQADVRSAQEAVATAESATVTYQPITTGTLAWSEATPNGIHFDMASLEQMGQEIAALL
jgi:hypothetical protein